ncbi:MAG: MFS transporter, partial [Calditerricola sp.]|nr:MFS transporter [Calditerricola sp.]
MRRQLGVVMLTLITTFVGFGLIIPVMPEMVQDAGAAPVHLGLLLSVYAAASFVCSPLWGGLSDRIGRRPVILTGLFGFAVSFVLFGLADHRLWLMYVSRFLGGVFSGAAVSCTVAYVADITTEAERTRAMGL